MDKNAISSRLDDNLARVRNLVSIYDTKLTTAGQGRRPVGSADVLRAAVVLLHATMEDVIRSLSMGLLPSQGREILDKIPLTGAGSHGRTEKFLLGKLAAFRGKTVDDILAESVKGFLKRSNYNHPEDIAAAIVNAGLDKTSVEPLFGTLEAMMDRRHWIVHRADHNPKTGQGQHKAKSIGLGTVNAWIETVETFGNDLIGQLP